MADGKDSNEKIADSQTDNLNSEEGKQSSQKSTDLAVQLQELQRKFDALSRSMQSDKDKAVSKTNQRIDGLETSLREVLQTAAKEGRSATDVLSDIEAQEDREARALTLEMARAFREGKLIGNGAGGSATKSDVDVDAVVKDLELDESDIRVKAFKAQSFASEAEALKAAAKLQKSILTTQPSDADKPGDVGERKGVAPKQEQLMAEYKEGSKNLRGMALINYKQEMRKKGLDIH